MNAAFLLVTSAWFAGQTPAPAPAAAAAPVPSTGIASAPLGCANGNCGGSYGGSYGASYGGGCCDSCGYDACCGSGHSFCGKLKGFFGKHHNSCNTCNTCDSCGSASYSGHGHHGWSGGSSCCSTSYSSCNTCDTCSSGCGHHGGRMKGFFSKHHNSGCCDTCDSCGSTGCAGCAGGYGGVGGINGSIVPTPAPANGTSGEQIQVQPKKMPTKEVVPAPKADKQVRINNAPAIGAPIAPATPNLEVVPPTTPSLEAERRDPPF